MLAQMNEGLRTLYYMEEPEVNKVFPYGLAACDGLKRTRTFALEAGCEHPGDALGRPPAERKQWLVDFPLGKVRFASAREDESCSK